MELLASATTTGTWWIVPLNADGTPAAIQAFRATCLKSGRFRMAGGQSPWFDPTTARYATPDMVGNMAAEHNITLFSGDVCSIRKLMKATHAWKVFVDLDGALAHKHQGKSMPGAATIIAAYADGVDAVIEA